MYDCDEVKNLIDKYIERGGEYVELEEGVLGWGTVALVDASGKLKQFIIQEKYLNEWSSTHTITSFIKRGIPKKYEKSLEEQGFYRGVDFR